MRILITGICGFVGSTLARRLWKELSDAEVFGLDNFVRPGSERNRLTLAAEGIEVRHADLRTASDIEALPDADGVIDAAASPSVLAGVDRRTSSRQLVEHNLTGNINLLEYYKAGRPGLFCQARAGLRIKQRTAPVDWMWRRRFRPKFRPRPLAWRIFGKQFLVVATKSAE